MCIGVEKRSVSMLGECPKGFQIAGCGIRLSEAVVWAGGSHGAGSETVSYDLSWFLASGVRSYPGGPDIFASGVVGGEKKVERERYDRRVRRWFPPKRRACRITLRHYQTPDIGSTSHLTSPVS